MQRGSSCVDDGMQILLARQQAPLLPVRMLRLISNRAMDLHGECVER